MKQIPPKVLLVFRVLGLFCFFVAGFLVGAIFFPTSWAACLVGGILAEWLGVRWLWRR